MKRQVEYVENKIIQEKKRKEQEKVRREKEKDAGE